MVQLGTKGAKGAVDAMVTFINSKHEKGNEQNTEKIIKILQKLGCTSKNGHVVYEYKDTKCCHVARLTIQQKTTTMLYSQTKALIVSG